MEKEKFENLYADNNNMRVYELLKLIEYNFRDERQVSFYANKLCLSTKRLNEVLKSKTNKTVSEIIHERLIIEAKNEIVIDKKSIKEVALDLGFSDLSYFNRFFKKHTGFSPQDYRVNC